MNGLLSTHLLYCSQVATEAVLATLSLRQRHHPIACHGLSQPHLLPKMHHVLSLGNNWRKNPIFINPQPRIYKRNKTSTPNRRRKQNNTKLSDEWSFVYSSPVLQPGGDGGGFGDVIASPKIPPNCLSCFISTPSPSQNASHFALLSLGNNWRKRNSQDKILMMGDGLYWMDKW
ncbi:hypothetical protein CDAR_72481 [Caerostris darwini]|uniref:Uncharacterized protein n=1 Tax=Caerostris darwini TaxID=1538125 RepID=A0AAV4MMV6_9ARAC|nr:hypothetical protein CDAR_72481 [Caerostris darwini]